MTREDAIEILYERKNTMEYVTDNDDLAFDMAIKALEYEPTTKNNLGVDCISRADARKAIIEYQYSDSFCEEHNIDHSINTSMALLALSDLPSVTPQKCKVGRWIFVEGIKGKDNVEKCSCCGSHWKEAIIYRTDTHEYLRTRLLYCPNCGSRNEVEE